MSLKLATWNINSLKVRLPLVQSWIHTHSPDILLLQEIKCTEDTFPKTLFEDLNYYCAVYGQKAFNGVAILSKFPLEDIQKGFPNLSSSQGLEEARYISALVSLPTAALRVASVYVPNGQSVDSLKYQEKLLFLKRLREIMKDLLTYEEILCLGGDYNIAPTDQDVYDPKGWQDHILCSVSERRAFDALLNLGYSDAFSQKHPCKEGFTWWDYRNQSFFKNHGARIDHILLSPQACDALLKCWIDTEPRAQPVPSDHTPLLVELNIV